MSAEAKLQALGVSNCLPPRPRVAFTSRSSSWGNLAYVSGHGPFCSDGSYLTGRVGADLDLNEGKAAAKQTALALLATLKQELGSLDRVKRVIKLLGMVNSTPEFGDHPKVINGCSELFAQSGEMKLALMLAVRSAWVRCQVASAVRDRGDL